MPRRYLVQDTFGRFSLSSCPLVLHEDNLVHHRTYLDEGAMVERTPSRRIRNMADMSQFKVSRARGLLIDFIQVNTNARNSLSRKSFSRELAIPWRNRRTPMNMRSDRMRGLRDRKNSSVTLKKASQNSSKRLVCVSAIQVSVGGWRKFNAAAQVKFCTF